MTKEEKLRARYEALVVREKQHREAINGMRRALIQLSRERKSAYREFCNARDQIKEETPNQEFDGWKARQRKGS